MSKTRLAAMAALGLIAVVVATGVLVFVPAGSLDYWQAWVFCGIFFILSLVVSIYLFLRDPDLLQRRLQSHEPESRQRLIIVAIKILYCAGFVVSGLDHRFGWSHVATWLVLASDAAIIAGYVLVFLTFRANPYAASVVRVESEQRVVSSGPYAIVRHPMYVGGMPMLTLIPLALGSYWGLLAFAPLPALLAMRIRNEEEVLLRELPGYEDYCRQVKWRLLPGVW